MTTPLKSVLRQVFQFGVDARRYDVFEDWWNVWKDDPEFIQSLENHLKAYYEAKENKLKEELF